MVHFLKSIIVGKRTYLRLCLLENCGNSEGDGNNRPPDLPLEKPVCRSGSNS